MYQGTQLDGFSAGGHNSGTCCEKCMPVRCIHLSRAGISHRHLCRHTSLLGVHLSLACISLKNASYLYLTGVCLVGACISQAVHIGVVHLTGCAQLMACISGCVSFAGIHLKGLHLIGVHFTRLHLMGAYISQNVHLRYLYLMGVALSRARITQACILRLSSPCLNYVPGR
jgi:uncharacterized protein YjbI with pentapeptide repeats